jgi:hypothetical protein
MNAVMVRTWDRFGWLLLGALATLMIIIVLFSGI